MCIRDRHHAVALAENGVSEALFQLAFTWWIECLLQTAVERNGSAAVPLGKMCIRDRIIYCYTYRLLSAGATQGELPEGQEKVPWGKMCIRDRVCAKQPHAAITAFGLSLRSLWNARIFL